MVKAEQVNEEETQMIAENKKTKDLEEAGLTV